MLVTNWLTNWLTDSCLVNLINVSLVCEDGNSKLVEVVTVVEVDDEKRVDNSLVQIWKVKFGHKVKFRLWDLRFRQDFEAEVWSLFCCWCLVVAMKFILGRDSAFVWSRFLSLSFVEMVMFGWDFEVCARSRFWRCLIKICVWTCDMTQRSYFGK